jgi:hypothetical protein
MGHRGIASPPARTALAVAALPQALPEASGRQPVTRTPVGRTPNLSFGGTTPFNAKYGSGYFLPKFGADFSA